ncbi:MAG: hypothetical protein FWG92_04165 [Leptospirales bacterium]|nr:hypothetical protein [Leptospirales bacterium]
MDLIIRNIIKITVFCVTFAVSVKFLLAFFRRKNPETDWVDPRIIFTAGMLSALVAILVSRIVKIFI